MTTVSGTNRAVDGTVQRVDRKSGLATVLFGSEVSGVRSVEVFLPAFFGGQFAPYPREGTHLHMQIVDPPGAGSPRVIEAWSDAQRGQLTEG